MAHELGHAIHYMLSADHSILTYQPSLPLAETASTFGELLVVDRLLSEDPDPETQRDLLFRQMDTNYATIMRQVYFALFERKAHELTRQGASVDTVRAIQRELVVRGYDAGVADVTFDTAGHPAVAAQLPGVSRVLGRIVLLMVYIWLIFQEGEPFTMEQNPHGQESHLQRPLSPRRHLRTTS